MTSPSERLLMAAEILEKRASEATEGPWKLSRTGASAKDPGRLIGIDGGEHGYDEVVATGNVMCMAYCYGGTSTLELSEADARYIATMHPEVGKALAALLGHAGRLLAAKEDVYQLAADAVLAGEQEQARG